MASGHIFIFHDDDDPRPLSVREGEVVATGQRGDEQHYPDNRKFSCSAAQIRIIRTRSISIDNSIGSDLSAPTHLWPDPARGMSRVMLRYVVERSLPGNAPLPQGNNQLQSLSEICSVIWSLNCDREPFQDVAKAILEDWKNGKTAEHEAEAKWLTIIAFVLGRDHDLKDYLKNLVWLFNASLECPIEYLHTWINEEALKLRVAHINSDAIRKIYSDLSKDGVDLGLGWKTHRERRGNLLAMSPQKLTNHVLEVLKKETGDEIADTGGDGRCVPKSSKAARNSGQRGGRGGDLWELFEIVFRSPSKEEDEGASGILNLMDEANNKQKEWKDLKQDHIDTLITWRNGKQRRWHPAPVASNGRPVSPVDA